jgi:hypothetical protein
MFRVIGTVRNIPHTVVIEPSGRIAATQQPDDVYRPHKPVAAIPGTKQAVFDEELRTGVFRSPEVAVCLAEIAALRLNLVNVQVVEYE